MKMLITGGTGFIGSHIVDQLQKEGYEIILFKGDITKKEDWEENLKDGVDTIVHVAGIRTQTTLDFEVNSGSVKVLAKVLSHRDVLPSSLIYISSQAVYFGLTPPFKEEMKVNPTTPYSKSKLEGEMLFLKIGKELGIRTVALRISTVLGPGVRIGNKMSGPLAIWIHNALKGDPLIVNQDGKQTRDYIHVDDVASATILAIQNNQVDGIFNCSGGKRIKLIEFANWVKEAAKSKSQIIVNGGDPTPGDPRDLFSDINKIAKFGWQPTKSAKEAVFEAAT
jgi:nucleoside-diphosphate-sugar epimerase